MKKVKKNIFLKLIFNILKVYKMKMKIGKIEKLVANLHDKNYVIHIINLKQVLSHELVLKKVYRVIKFNQKAWVKSYIKIAQS